jgi:cystathionine beta-lyase
MPFGDLDVAALRKRRSAKWSVYPPDVLPAWVAEMDFPLAEPVRAALHEAVERGDAGYPREGELPDAFVAFAQRAFGWTIDPARVFMVPDVMDGVAKALELLTERGAQVVINSPIYPPFFAVPAAVERRIVDVPLRRDGEGWALDLDGLERAFAAGARTYLLCNPHNPVGRAFTRAELEAVADVAKRYGVLVISDEIHAPLVLPGATHVPFAFVSEPRGVDAVVLTSASKAWNIAGLKCAQLVACTPRLKTVPRSVRYSVGIFGLFASVAAFRDGGPYLAEVIAQLDRNRALLGELVARELPGVRYRAPEASYLTWLDCSALGLGDDPAAVFLERGKVALSRGRDFGAANAQYARLNIGTSEAILREVVDRMRRALAR